MVRIKDIVIRRLNSILKKNTSPNLFRDDPKKYGKFLKIINKVESVEYREDEIVLKTGNDEIFLRKKGSDVNVYWQIFINREYQTVVDTTDLNKIEIKTIIDAGSNIGLTALYFSNHFSEAKIIALEPDKENYEQLVKNTEKRSNENVLLQKAVWSENTNVYLHNDFRDNQEWSRRVLKTETATKIEAVSINSIIEKYKIETVDILKIDIEGGEAEIFRSDCDLSFLDKTKILAIEIHDELNCREKINKILFDNKFVMYNSGELTVAINTNFLTKS